MKTIIIRLVSFILIFNILFSSLLPNLVLALVRDDNGEVVSTDSGSADAATYSSFGDLLNYTPPAYVAPAEVAQEPPPPSFGLHDFPQEPAPQPTQQPEAIPPSGLKDFPQQPAPTEAPAPQPPSGLHDFPQAPQNPAPPPAPQPPPPPSGLHDFPAPPAGGPVTNPSSQGSAVSAYQASSSDISKREQDQLKRQRQQDEQVIPTSFIADIPATVAQAAQAVEDGAYSEVHYITSKSPDTQQKQRQDLADKKLADATKDLDTANQQNQQKAEEYFSSPPETKLAPLNRAFNIDPATPSDQAFSKIGANTQQMGINLQGGPLNFTVSIDPNSVFSFIGNTANQAKSGLNSATNTYNSSLGIGKFAPGLQPATFGLNAANYLVQHPDVTANLATAGFSSIVQRNNEINDADVALNPLRQTSGLDQFMSAPTSGTAPRRDYDAAVLTDYTAMAAAIANGTYRSPEEAFADPAYANLSYLGGSIDGFKKYLGASTEQRKSLDQVRDRTTGLLMQDTDNAANAAAIVAMTVAAGPTLEIAGDFAAPVVRAGATKAGDAISAVGKILRRGGSDLLGDSEPVFVAASQRGPDTVVLENAIPLADRPEYKQANDFLMQVFPNRLIPINKSEIPLVSKWISDGVTPQQIQDTFAQARKLVDYLYRDGSGIPKPPPPQAPDDIRQAWQAYRYLGSDSTSQSGTAALLHSDLTTNPRADLGIVDAIIEKNKQVADPQLKKILATANSKLKQADAFVQQYHPNPGLSAPNQVTPHNVFVVSPKTIKDAAGGRDGLGGLYSSSDSSVLINAEALDTGNPITNWQNAVRIAYHECLHDCQFTANPNVSQQLVQAMGGDDGRTKVIEAATEYSTQYFSESTSVKNIIRSSEPIGPLVTSKDQRLITVVYQDLVTKMHDEVIPLIMKNNNYSRQQADAIVMGAARQGRFDEMIAAAGGNKVMQEIFDAVPAVTGNVVTEVPKAVISKDKALAVVGVLASAGAASYCYLNDCSNILPKKGAFRLISEAYAQGQDANQSASVLDIKKFELQVKKELVKNALIEDGQVDSDTVKSVLKTDIISSESEETPNGYALTTGKAGTVKQVVEKNKYIVSIQSIPGFDISFPKIIDAANNTNVTIPVGIKTGTGQVKNVSFNYSQNQPKSYLGALIKSITNLASSLKLNKVAYAQSSPSNTSNSASPNVSVLVFADDNGNGILDSNEKVLPWAGVQVSLTRLSNQQSVDLNPGWNLVTLTALPNSPLTASVLIKNINDQGGDATSVSTLVDGAWKTYVVRDGQPLSSEDFTIEPGKGYFVKSNKPSTFTFSGQKFVAPLNLDLKEGWNTIGIPNPAKAYKASDIIDTLNSKQANADAISSFDFGLWNTLVRKLAQNFGKNFAIDQGRGYVVRLEKGVQVSF